MEFEEWLLRTGNLKLATVQGRPMPYKPAMLLAAILLVRKGQFADNLILFDEICSAFDQVLGEVAPASPGPSDRKLPFRHLESDGIWTLVPRVGEDASLAAKLALSARAREVLRHAAGARLPEDVFAALRDSPANALRAMECVLRHHADVFTAWGLADVSCAQRTLALWLAGADQPSAELTSASQKRSLGEREVEQAIQENWAATPFGARGLELVARQRVTPVNTIDLLARNPATDTWWVLELKRQNSSDAVVGQISRYRGWIASHHGVAVEQACGIILTDKVSERLRHAVRVQRGVELWCYDDNLAMERVRA